MIPVIDDLALPFFWFLGRSESDLQHTCSKYTGSHGLHVLDPSFSILVILVVLHIYPLQMFLSLKTPLQYMSFCTLPKIL